MICGNFLNCLISDIKHKVSEYYPDVNQSIDEILSGQCFPSDKDTDYYMLYLKLVDKLVNNVSKFSSSVCSNISKRYKESIAVEVYSNKCVKLMNSSKWDGYISKFIYFLTMESIRFTIISVRIIKLLSFVILPNKYSIQYNYDKFDYESSNECFNVNKTIFDSYDGLFSLRSYECYTHMYLNMFSNQMEYHRFYINTNPYSLLKKTIEMDCFYKMFNELNDQLISQRGDIHSWSASTCHGHSYLNKLKLRLKRIDTKHDNFANINKGMVYEIICRIVKNNEKILGAVKKNLSIDSEYAKKLFLYDLIYDSALVLIDYQ